MAVITTKVDDMDQSTDAETVTFSIGEEFYQVDLSEANEAKLRKALNPFVNAAREVEARTVLRSLTPKVARSTGTAEIRNWAQSNGYKVSDRGRIPADVEEAFNKAQTT